MKKRAVLPRSIPFIDSVFQFVEGKVSCKRAIDILAGAEKKFGLRIRGEYPFSNEISAEDWYHSIARMDAAVEPFREVAAVPDPSPSPDIEEMEWKREKEAFQSECEQHERELDVRLPEAMGRKLAHESKLVNRHLYPFMSHTGFVVTGEHFSNEHEILFEDGTTLTSSWRSWGELVADWANETKWLTPLWDDGTEFKWDYRDFYMNTELDDLIERWDEWYNGFLTVLWMKSQRADRPKSR